MRCCLLIRETKTKIAKMATMGTVALKDKEIDRVKAK